MSAGEPVVLRVAAGDDRLAVVDPVGSWTYAELDRQARALATRLLGERADLAGRRVALLTAAGRDFVVALLGCWHAGGMAVPLHPAHPVPELRYVVDDADVDAIVASREHVGKAERLAGPNAPVLVVDEDTGAAPLDGSRATRDGPALMIHTSGTTGRPKGVVHTHGSIAAQVDGMLAAWDWRPDDRIVLVLPLNHVHGVVNVVLCALAAGAVCEAPGEFDAVAVWERLASGVVTVFMAVPTIYARMVAAWEQADSVTRGRWSAGAAGLRLMVSGSAALPVSTLARWRELTGHTLLERYGMTELGMTLGNTLTTRVPGHVGVPFPGVEVRVVDETGADVVDGQPGELLVRGPNVFREYWRRPDATAAAFVDGWFRTGDVAQHTPDGYRLLGRSSIDIIKSGGEKVSALEIEEVYREHPDVVDLAVVGVEDPAWGERVSAAVVLRPGATADPDALRDWGKRRLAPAKVPQRWRLVDELPRNTLGKVVKPAVRELF